LKKLSIYWKQNKLGLCGYEAELRR
jgi:hypothetical protein